MSFIHISNIICSQSTWNPHILPCNILSKNFGILTFSTQWVWNPHVFFYCVQTICRWEPSEFQCIVWSTQYIVWSTQYIVWSRQYTVWSTHYIVCWYWPIYCERISMSHPIVFINVFVIKNKTMINTNTQTFLLFSLCIRINLALVSKVDD